MIQLYLGLARNVIWVFFVTLYIKNPNELLGQPYIYLGEGNGNPLQYSCLENPRDRGAWWAAVCGVAQS